MSDLSKIFYVGFQRCGTKSFKSIVSQNGFKTVSWQECEKNDWATLVIEKKFEEIVACDDFSKSNYYEDFPFQVYDFVVFLSEKYPNSKFIHVERDPISWFESMVSHSGGANPGMDDCYTHAVYYERMELWNYLKDKLGRRPRKLPIIASQDHYTRFYARENLRISTYLSENLSEDRYLLGRLDERNLYSRICDFLGFPQTLPSSYHKSDKANAIKQLKENFPFL